MNKDIYFYFPNGQVYSVSRLNLAELRARQKAATEAISEDSNLFRGLVAQYENSKNLGKWAQENMKWSDIATYATRLNDMTETQYLTRFFSATLVVD